MHVLHVRHKNRHTAISREGRSQAGPKDRYPGGAPRLLVIDSAKIFSAMAMAMSIYVTLCVLLSLKISLLEMPIAFGN